MSLLLWAGVCVLALILVVPGVEARTPQFPPGKASAQSAAKEKAARKKKRRKMRRKRRRRRRRSKRRRGKRITFTSVTVANRVGEDPFKSTRAITVLNEKRLREKRPRTTPEALMEEPGVFVQKTNHGAGAPIIRGTVGPQLLLLIDGVRLINSTYRSGPNQYLNMVDPWSLGQLEVLRGSGSLAYGGYAFGGVINMKTRSPNFFYGEGTKFDGELIGRYSSADQERTGRVYGAIRSRNVAFQIGATYGVFGDLVPGGAISIRDPNGLGKTASLFPQKTEFGDLVTSGASGAQAYTGYQNLHLDSKLRWRFADRWNLEMLYQYAQVTDAGRADQLATKGDLRFYNNDRHFVYARLNGGFSKTKLKFTLSFHRQNENIRRFTLDTSNWAIKRERVYDDKVNTIGVQAEGLTIATRWLELSYGLDFYRDSVVESALNDRGKAKSGNFTPDSSYITAGAFVLAKARLLQWGGRNGLYLHLGDRVTGFFADSSARPDENIEAVSFNQVGNALSVAAQMLFANNFNFTFSYAEGYRAPNLQESAALGDQGNSFEVPNPDLGPEFSRTIEMTLKARFRRRFTAWLTTYYSFWQDMIVREATEFQGQTEIDGKPVERRINQARANVFGVETGASVWVLPRRLSFSGHLTWTQGSAVAEDGAETPLSRIPPLFGTFAARYNFLRRGFLEFFVVGALAQDRLSARDERDVRIPDGGTPGWFTLNIRGGANINRHARLVFAVENLLNTMYRYHGSGMMNAGLSGRLSLELNI